MTIVMTIFCWPKKRRVKPMQGEKLFTFNLLLFINSYRTSEVSHLQLLYFICSLLKTSDRFFIRELRQVLVFRKSLGEIRSLDCTVVKGIISTESNYDFRREEKEYKKWLSGQKEDLTDNTAKKELKPLRDFWNSEQLDKNEKFLRDYILNKGNFIAGYL